MNIKKKIENGKLNVSIKLEYGVSVNMDELQEVNALNLRNLMRFTELKRKKYLYSGPIAVTLAQFLKKPLSSKEFFTVIGHITSLLRQMYNRRLPVYNLILEKNYCYINEATMELKFIYIPLIGKTYDVSIISFISDIINNCKTETDEDRHRISAFADMFRNMNPFSPEKIEEYIKKIEGADFSYGNMQSQANSGFMTDKRKDYYQHYDNKGGGFDAGRNGADWNRNYNGEIDTDGTGLLTNSPEYIENQGWGNEQNIDDDGTGLLQQDHWKTMAGDFNENGGGFIRDNNLNVGGMANDPWGAGSDIYDDGTGLLGGENFGGNNGTDADIFDDGTGLLNVNSQFGSASGSSIPNSSRKTSYAETKGYDNKGYGTEGAALRDGYYENVSFMTECGNQDGYTNETGDDENGTTVLTFTNTGMSSAPPHFPRLKRLSTGEENFVNKPSYRVGKEKAYVDFYVSNNSAVSRSHADIVSRGSKYFIKDLNSTNHTFINGQMIPVQFEMEIKDGDRITLANEDFIFTV